MKVCCVFSLESPHRGDSNECTQHTIYYQYKKENHLKLSQKLIMSAAMGFSLLGTQRRVRNSRGE